MNNSFILFGDVFPFQIILTVYFIELKSGLKRNNLKYTSTNLFMYQTTWYTQQQAVIQNFIDISLVAKKIFFIMSQIAKQNFTIKKQFIPNPTIKCIVYKDIIFLKIIKQQPQKSLCFVARVIPQICFSQLCFLDESIQPYQAFVIRPQTCFYQIMISI